MTFYDSVWRPCFAGVYDAAFAMAERSGLAAIREEIAGQATGRVIELGAGTGLNLDHYAGVTELLLTEPDPHMAARLRKRVAGQSGEVTIIEASAEDLPVDSASVDTVVSTLVLCTVLDPDRSLAEVTRVLRPGGKLVFVEHVRSRSVRLAAWQDRLKDQWSWFACGCQCNRDTVSMIEKSPLEILSLRDDRLHWLGPLISPLSIGVATVPI